ncbi:MAG: polysaccharide biosynthesis/export family protein [Planctomycetota bacterium]
MRPVSTAGLLAARLSATVTCVMCVTAVTGCSGFRPLTGVPVDTLPQTFRLPDRTGRVPINFALLGQQRPEVHRVDAGDTLGIYIEGVLGQDGVQPPSPQNPSGLIRPSLGFPVGVDRDGTITLPQAGTVEVAGLSLDEVRTKLFLLYSEELELIRPEPGSVPVIVTLVSARTRRVLVIRDEGGPDTGIDAPDLNTTFNDDRGGAGFVVELPAYENDVLHALVESGGLPGPNAENAVYVIRTGRGSTRGGGVESHPAGGMTLADLPVVAAHPSVRQFVPHDVSGATVLRIPLREVPGVPVNFGPEDVLLEEGDIVFVDGRQTDVFYTGGLLGLGQYQLPRDYDVDVPQALALVQNGLRNTGFPADNIAGVSVLNKDVRAGASEVIVLRPLPDGGSLPIRVDLYQSQRKKSEKLYIRPGDTIVLQFTKAEAIAAFVERNFLEGVVLGLASGITF